MMKWTVSVSLALLAAQAAVVAAQQAPATVAAVPEFAPRADSAAEQRTEFRTLDEDVQDLKKQTAVFISMDVGEFFGLDSVELKIDDNDVANYLYTEREADALLKGGVQRLFIGNLKAGEHELVAVFTGQGPHTRDYRRAASLVFEKGIGPKYIELTISDRVSKQQPEFVVKEWE